MINLRFWTVIETIEDDDGFEVPEIRGSWFTVDEAIEAIGEKDILRCEIYPTRLDRPIYLEEE